MKLRLATSIVIVAILAALSGIAPPPSLRLNTFLLRQPPTSDSAMA